MNISAAAKITGLSTKQIRDYEKADLLDDVARTYSGYRTYSDGDIDRLRFIAHAREVGFSLAQIKTLISLQQNPARSGCQVKEIAREHIDTLNQKITMLTQMRDILMAWETKCDHQTGECFIIQSLAHARDTGDNDSTNHNASNHNTKTPLPPTKAL